MEEGFGDKKSGSKFPVVSDRLCDLVQAIYHVSGSISSC